jgi:chitin disaccharide deacetylase
MDSTPPRLVLHADDLGLNRAVTDGILRGFREGPLTSTSLLANAPDVPRAVEQWKTLLADQAAGRLPSAAVRAALGDPPKPFDLGVHLNLTQGRPLLGNRFPAELLDARGRFCGIYALFARLKWHGSRFGDAIRAELSRQVQMVCDLGLRPTHLNGHQYIEMIPGISEIVLELVAQFDIRVIRVAREQALWRSTVLRGHLGKWPLALVKRWYAGRLRSRVDALGIPHPDAFFGTVHAGDVARPTLERWLAHACNDRLVEVGLHPAEASDGSSAEDRGAGWHDPLAAARPRELQMLVAAELPKSLEAAGFRLGRLGM